MVLRWSCVETASIVVLCTRASRGRILCTVTSKKEIRFFSTVLLTQESSYWTKSNQILLRCNPRPWFIEPSFLVIRWMWSASLTFLFLPCCSRSTTIAFQCTWCPVVCACSATADLYKCPNLVSDLCSLILCAAVLRVSPTYTCSRRILSHILLQVSPPPSAYLSLPSWSTI